VLCGLRGRLESELWGGVGTWRWPETSSIDGRISMLAAAAAGDDWDHALVRDSIRVPCTNVPCFGSWCELYTVYKYTSG
jgi:hypothetical protein